MQKTSAFGNGEIFIDFVAPDTRIDDIQLGVPVSINIENGVAAMALAHLNGVTDEEIKRGMASFRGVDRRFDFKIKNDRIVFLSDYAHHPSEIKQSVLSMRELYKDKKITAIFHGTKDLGWHPCGGLKIEVGLPVVPRVSICC